VKNKKHFLPIEKTGGTDIINIERNNFPNAITKTVYPRGRK